MPMDLAILLHPKLLVGMEWKDEQLCKKLNYLSKCGLENVHMYSIEYFQINITSDIREALLNNIQHEVIFIFLKSYARLTLIC